VGDIGLLEEADGGDTCGSSFEAIAGVRECNSSESEDRYAGLASLAEQRYSCWLGGASFLLFKDWGEDGESRAIGCRLGYILWGVTRNSDERRSMPDFAGGSTCAAPVDRAYYSRRNIAGAQVDSIGMDRHCHIGAGIDEKRGPQCPVLSSQFIEHSHGFASQGFEIPG
jgi:hypothetical protein